MYVCSQRGVFYLSFVAADESRLSRAQNDARSESAATDLGTQNAPREKAANLEDLEGQAEATDER
jgi:hypothetical protein